MNLQYWLGLPRQSLTDRQWYPTQHPHVKTVSPVLSGEDVKTPPIICRERSEDEQPTMVSGPVSACSERPEADYPGNPVRQATTRSRGDRTPL